MAKRLEGTLSVWNDIEGTGWIIPAEGEGRYFVRRAAFPKTGPAPQLGEELWFDAETNNDGHPEARNLVRPDMRPPVMEPVPEYIPPRLSRASTRSLPGFVETLFVLAVLYGGYLWWKGEFPTDYDSAVTKIKADLRHWLDDNTAH